MLFMHCYGVIERMEQIRACVVGATGFAGVEVCRIVLGHPALELTMATDRKAAGTRLADVYPAFEGACDLVLSLPEPEAIAQNADVAFLAVPHTASLAITPQLLALGVTVIDLSADYRLHDAAVYEQWYGTPHTSPELLATRTFGLPEIFAEDLAGAAARHAAGEATLVACAGCYPTATSLGAYPAIDAGLLADDAVVIVDAISGVTGAGKSANARTHYCSADECVEAYGVCKHRHTPEIEQILGLPDHVVFTPHLAPLKRGLLSTINIPLAEVPAQELTLDMVVERYREFYEGRPFVRVLDAGQVPKTSSVAGSNACQIGLALNKTARMLVVTSAIDNLCKGAAGQAIQCANVVFGLDERRGLPLIAMPV